MREFMDVPENCRVVTGGLFVPPPAMSFDPAPDT